MDSLDNTPNNENPNKNNDNVGFIIFRLIFVILIALFIFSVRYLSPKTYEEMKYYYDNYISVNITADYYLSEE